MLSNRTRIRHSNIAKVMAYTFVKEGVLCTALLNENEKNSIGFYVEYFKDDFEKIIEFRT